MRTVELLSEGLISVQETCRKALEDLLRDQGFIGGIMPVQVTVRASNSGPDAFVIRFNRK